MNLGSLLAQPSPNLFNDQHRCIVRVNARLALTQHLHQGFIALPELQKPRAVNVKNTCGFSLILSPKYRLCARSKNRLRSHPTDRRRCPHDGPRNRMLCAVHGPSAC